MQSRVRLHPKGVPVYTCIHAVLGVACIHAVYTHLKYMECQHGQVTSNLLLQYTNDTIALRCCHDHVGSSVASTCATNTWPAPPLAVALVVDTRSAMGIVYGSESFTSCTLARSHRFALLNTCSETILVLDCRDFDKYCLVFL